MADMSVLTTVFNSFAKVMTLARSVAVAEEAAVTFSVVRVGICEIHLAHSFVSLPFSSSIGSRKGGFPNLAIFVLDVCAFYVCPDRVSYCQFKNPVPCLSGVSPY